MTCGICLDTLVIDAYDASGSHGHNEVRCACGHAYHAQCIALWFLKSGHVKCPTCSGKAAKRSDKQLRRNVRAAQACLLLGLFACVSQSWAYAQLALIYGLLMISMGSTASFVVLMGSLTWARAEVHVSSFQTCALACLAFVVGLCVT